MLPWWPKQVRARLSPHEVSLSDGRGIERYPLESANDLVEWRPALEMLREKLAPPRFAGRLSLEVELSNHFVSYLVVPRRAELRGRAELEAFVRHRFVHTYGPTAQHWVLCLSSDATARVAAAVDAALIQGLQSLCKQRKLKLASVVPALSAGFDQARIAKDHDRYWFVQRERGRVCIGCVELGHWALIHGQGLISGDAEELNAIFQQLTMASPAWIPDLPIYTQGFDANTLAALLKQGWKIRQAGPLKVNVVKPRKGAVQSKASSAESVP